MFEVRFHGRGGQGCWTASELLARAALNEGKHIQSFPEFGPERMGAPVTAFTRIDEKPIDLHCNIYAPDVSAVLDPTLLKTVPVADGLPKKGVLLVNTREEPSQLRERLGIKGRKIWTIPATDIAVEILGREITNTVMLGAVAKATNVVKLESIMEAVKGRFPDKIAEKNIEMIKRAYEEAKSE